MIDPDYEYDWIGFEMTIYQFGNLDWSRLNSWLIWIEVKIDRIVVMIDRKWGQDLI